MYAKTPEKKTAARQITSIRDNIDKANEKSTLRLHFSASGTNLNLAPHGGMRFAFPPYILTRLPTPCRGLIYQALHLVPKLLLGNQETASQVRPSFVERTPCFGIILRLYLTFPKDIFPLEQFNFINRFYALNSVHDDRIMSNPSKNFIAALP